MTSEFSPALEWVKRLGPIATRVPRQIADPLIYRILNYIQTKAPLPKHQEDIGKAIALLKQYPSAMELARRFFRLRANVRGRWIENLGGWQVAKGPLRASRAAANLGGPFLGAMSPLARCNLRCVGCYSEARLENPKNESPSEMVARLIREGKEMSSELVDRLIDEGKKIGIHFWTIIGGEPFLRRDLLEIYRRHSDCGFQVYTNGTLIDDETADIIAELGNVAPAISLEGFAKETTARRKFYKGKPVYDYVMETMGRLNERGIFFGASVTATRLNLETISSDEFIQMLCDKGCLFAWYFIYMPVATHDPKDIDELMLTPEQRCQMAERIWYFRKNYPIFAADFWSDGSLTQGCMAFGRLYFHITHKGDVEPSVFFHFATDNIHDKSLEEALNSPFFRAGRSLFPWTCNLRMPCPVIDHPHILRKLVEEYKAYPTTSEADGVITTLAPRLDEYSARMAELTG